MIDIYAIGTVAKIISLKCYLDARIKNQRIMETSKSFLSPEILKLSSFQFTLGYRFTQLHLYYINI